MNEIHQMARAALARVVRAQAPAATVWTGSPLEEFGRVEIDTRGTAGELLVVNLLEKSGRKVDYRENATNAEKHWDFMCDGLRYEVKTARLGRGGSVFQHENIFKTRQYDGLIFVDIAPDEIYISLWVKADIVWRDLHPRKDGAYFKWDTSLTSPAVMKRGQRRKFCVRDCAVRSAADFARRFARFERDLRAKQRPAASL